jgi:hypothetical protein
MRWRPLVSCVSLTKHFGLTGAQQIYPDDCESLNRWRIPERAGSSPSASAAEYQHGEAFSALALSRYQLYQVRSRLLLISISPTSRRNSASLT